LISLYKNITSTDKFTALQGLSKDSGCIIETGGLSGSSASFAVAKLFNEVKANILVITPTPLKAERALNDLVSLVGQDSICYLPVSKSQRYHAAINALGPKNERIDTILRLNSAEPTIVVSLPDVLTEPFPSQSWVNDNTINLSIGVDDEYYLREELLTKISSAGYQRESMINAQGQFAVRGALLDIYPYGHEFPVRLEYEDEEITSIRTFDPSTQRSLAKVKSVKILLEEDDNETESQLFDILSSDTIVFWSGVEEISDRLTHNLSKSTSQDMSEALIRDEALGTHGEALAELLNQAGRLRQIKVNELFNPNQDGLDFNCVIPDPFPTGLNELPEYLKAYTDNGFKVWVTTDTDGECDRLNELFFDSNMTDTRAITPMVSAGFVLKSDGIVVLTAHELFRRRRMRAHHQRFRRRNLTFDRSSLKMGEMVVHAEYGIGRYEGLRTVKVQQQPRECLRIRYAEDVILYIKIDQFTLVEKYSGTEGSKPTLSKIGGREWIKAKSKTRKVLKDIADELIKLYAKRKVIRGTAFSADTHWQQEMESSFEFVDTEDQVIAIRDIKQDLQAPHPMDRLLCGDVGFGKTEVAIRAAFKVVQDSHQVAILVPTTILAQQHYETFRERLAAFPVKIGVLSRFRTKSEQKETIAELKDGSIDIVIGTHRLLSKDIGFKQLGLLIIDEEHRFGVRHKELLKQLKVNVDVLALTATPIPRTMHMALVGARDTSKINTPPVDRLPIQTEIHPWSEGLIRDAILHEVDRKGQVFFLHNRVQSIHAVKEMLMRIAPDVEYGVAHGQLEERQLEKVMFEFMHGRYDVLVTTMIIESGLDIPNANTLIVNRADRFGLAQLYQLRGRIGRSSRQAYAYLLTPPKLSLTTDARVRLKTLSELTELGSGMKVAMRDLEIRGAGNLLGQQQSGFINSVGFDMYTRMLEEVISEAKGDETEEVTIRDNDVKIDFDGPALIPAKYMSDTDSRYNFYKRIAIVDNLEQLQNIRDEIVDRFGALPQQARNLHSIAELKVLCRQAGFNRLSISKGNVTATLNLSEDQSEMLRAIGKLVAMADPYTIEFKLDSGVEVVLKVNSSNDLTEVENFLRHLTRDGILQA